MNEEQIKLRIRAAVLAGVTGCDPEFLLQYARSALLSKRFDIIVERMKEERKVRRGR